MRTAVRNGPLASDAMPGPAVDPADEAQTDPGLATGGSVEDAATLPDQAEASTEPDPPAAGEGAEDGVTGDGTAEDSATGDGAVRDGVAKESAAEDGAAEDGAAEDGAAEPGPAKPKPSGRASRRARSKRAAADPPAEPDAADEWISLLTADPAEE
jgi:colicin import membrane protein